MANPALLATKSDRFSKSFSSASNKKFARSLIQDAKKNPGNATLITGIITALVNLSGVPLPIDSAIATAIALYVLHIGIDVFCEWSSPAI